MEGAGCVQRVQPFCIRFGNFETAICITQTYIYDIRCIYTQIEVSTKSQERKNREEKKIKKYFIAQQFSSMTRDSDAQHTQNTCTYAIAHTELPLWEHVDAAALFLLLAYVFFFYSTPLRNREKLLRLTELGMTVGTQQIGVKRNVNMGMAHHGKSVYMRVMNVCSVFGVRKSECVSCVMCIAYTTHNIGFERII